MRRTFPWADSIQSSRQACLQKVYSGVRCQTNGVNRRHCPFSSTKDEQRAHVGHAVLYNEPLRNGEDSYFEIFVKTHKLQKYLQKLEFRDYRTRESFSKLPSRTTNIDELPFRPARRVSRWSRKPFLGQDPPHCQKPTTKHPGEHPHETAPILSESAAKVLAALNRILGCSGTRQKWNHRNAKSVPSYFQWVGRRVREKLQRLWENVKTWATSW